MLELTQRRQDFLQVLQNHCDRPQDPDETLGLLFIDLLEFHRVNAVYGYQVGDQVLTETYHRILQAGFKDSELHRIGNDEFALILHNVKDPKLLSLAANKVVRIVGDPFHFEQRTVRLEPVIGIASQTGEQKVAEQLLVAAEKNLKEARSQNKRFIIHHQDDESRTLDWRFESLLHQAVANNDLELYYQPKIDMLTGRPSHAEALVRWHSQELGLVSPMDIIPLLEKTGGIADMTKWAIHTALRQLSEWPVVDKGEEYSVAVNVSSQVLDDEEFYQIVKSALNIWGTSPELLTLEITEGTLVREEHSSYRSIFRLKDLGLKISIDDFGTGYSCLSYFKRLPADELKIDQSFVTNMNTDQDDEHLTRVIIDLAHRFNLSVVAEGIEDQETYRRLKSFGCDYAQGFYISKPQPQDKYCDWLEQFDGEKLIGE